MSFISNVWSIEDYCAAQQQQGLALDIEGHVEHETSRKFLYALNLPTQHPFCTQFFQSTNNYSDYYFLDVPRQGPLISTDHLETWWDVVITVLALTSASMAAMTELWLRFFALLLAPLFMGILLWDEYQATKIIATSKKSQKHHHSPSRLESFAMSSASLLSVASSIVLMTDTLYVLEFDGPQMGATYLAINSVLAWRACSRHDLLWARRLLVGILLPLCLYLVVGNDLRFHFGESLEQATNVKEGLYFDTNNSFISRTTQLYKLSSNNHRTWMYSKDIATPWMLTGDARTGFAFLLNRLDEDNHLKWHRLWLQVPQDDEVVALDVCFPNKRGGYNSAKPVYFLLHGINGGTHEEFIRDFAHRNCVLDDATVVVMIARGLQDLPIRGWNNFHGARWTDAHEASKAVKRAIATLSSSSSSPSQLLVGVGYSMGAIILTNLVGRTGSDCALDAAVAISGGLDMRQQKTFYRAQRLFQPIITVALRDDFVLGKWGERVRARLTRSQMKALMRATHITDVDSICIVNYNGFHDLDHYYSEMSLLGDVVNYGGATEKTSSSPMTTTTIERHHRIHQVAIPTLVLHALDDPLITWRTVAANEGPMHPINLVQTGSGNLMLLLTKRGGHVGWSTGFWAHVDKWKWMNSVPVSFAQALMQAKHEEKIEQREQ